MRTADGKTAIEISERLLELTGKALLGNDFDSFALHFHVPHTIETPDRKTVLKTRAALEAVFDTVVQDYADRQVTKLIRFCEVAEFRGPFKVEATHISHMMCGDLRVMDPYPSFTVLEFIDGRWKATSSQYAVDGNTNVGRALNVGIEQNDMSPRTTLAGALEKKIH